VFQQGATGCRCSLPSQQGYSSLHIVTPLLQDQAGCAPVQQEVCLGPSDGPAADATGNPHVGSSSREARLAASVVCTTSMEWLHVQLFRATPAEQTDAQEALHSSGPSHSILAWSLVLPAASSGESAPVVLQLVPSCWYIRPCLSACQGGQFQLVQHCA
jgi:hypothetical protein